MEAFSALPPIWRFLAPIVLSVLSIGCSSLEPKTSFVYFGFDDHSEKQEDVIQLAKTWSSSPPCPHWRVTIDPKSADYRVLFGDADVTIIGRQGEIIYSGGQGVMYAPDGNPDGSGVNICKLTGE